MMHRASSRRPRPLWAIAALILAAAAAAQAPVLLKDINTKPAEPPGSYPGQFVRSGAFLFFAAETRATGTELYRTLGVQGSTQIIADLALRRLTLAFG